jgi:ribosome-binding protein aMBF1 (putative translation factor)
MARSKSITEWQADRGIALADLIAVSGVDRRVVEAIAEGRYTPSPEQRRRLAAALGVDVDQIAWGHRTAVDHIQGHGPQFGRSP